MDYCYTTYLSATALLGYLKVLHITVLHTNTSGRAPEFYGEDKALHGPLLDAPALYSN